MVLLERMVMRSLPRSAQDPRLLSRCVVQSSCAAQIRFATASALASRISLSRSPAEETTIHPSKRIRSIHGSPRISRIYPKPSPMGSTTFVTTGASHGRYHPRRHQSQHSHAYSTTSCCHQSDDHDGMSRTTDGTSRLDLLDVVDRLVLSLTQPKLIIDRSISNVSSSSSDSPTEAAASALHESSYNDATSEAHYDHNVTRIKHRQSSVHPSDQKSAGYAASINAAELARIVCKQYKTLAAIRFQIQPDMQANPCQRSRIIHFLAVECVPSEEVVRTAASTCLSNRTISRAALSAAIQPRYQALVEYLFEQSALDGMQFLIELRQDLLYVMRHVRQPAQARVANDARAESVANSKHDDDDTRLEDHDDNDEHCRRQLQVQLQEFDSFLRQFIAPWFSQGMLQTSRITYQHSPASVIEKIAKKEAVHPMRSLDDLRTRLGPKHRVFSLFHPLLPNNPIVFVHVSLQESDTTPASMAQVMGKKQNSADNSSSSAVQPKLAAFYSISNAQPGLAGIGLGEFLIKDSIRLLQSEFPNCIQSFVTLSPVPQFRRWMRTKLQQQLQPSSPFHDDTFVTLEDVRDLEAAGYLPTNSFAASDAQAAVSSTSISGDAAVAQALADMFAALDTSIGNVTNEKDDASIRRGIETYRDTPVESILMRFVARYLCLEKRRRKPLDAVARFHLGNGASLHRINFAADVSRKGLRSSYGIMVNYLYDLNTVAAKQQEFEFDHEIPKSRSVSHLLPRDSEQDQQRQRHPSDAKSSASPQLPSKL